MKIKGVLHVHSTYSYDGKESLRTLKDFLLAQGVSFCCLTEHTDQMTREQAQMFVQECKVLSGSQFVFIPGFEVPYKNAHILLIGTEVFLAQQADGETLKTWSDASALSVLAHPVRNSFEVDAIMEEVIDGVEIWNQQYEGKRVPRRHSVRLLRNLQRKNQALLATGGLDFHNREDFGSPYITLEVERATSGSILDALKNGEYVFGNESVSVTSMGIWKGNESISHAFLSLFSIGLIFARKTVNALSAKMGLRLHPKKPSVDISANIQ